MSQKNLAEKMEENKAKTVTRVKERRQPFNQESVPRRNTKHQGIFKSNLSQLSPPKSFDGTSPVKKLFSETNKILKIGMEKDYALVEKENILQNSNETIDNLRKNMFHLQMEYEKLDQNFQREIAYRSEIVKRMDATRELVESVVQCSNVLAASIKQVEDDKLKIAEFYELIYQTQKEVEAKHAQTENIIKEQNGLLKAKMDEINKFQDKILSQNTETISQLNNNLKIASEKLKITADENEKLQKKNQEFQESSNRLQTFLQQQEKLNCLHQETISQFKQNLKKLKIQRFKTQKLLKNKKRQLSIIVTKNKNLKKTLEKTQLLYSETLLANEVLKSENQELKSNFEKHLTEDETERQHWETQKRELVNRLSDKDTEIEDLLLENKNYNEKIMELATVEEAKRRDLEEVQNDLSKMLSENLKLKEDVTKLTEENSDKGKIISELEQKSSTVDANLNSQIELYKNECDKLRNAVKELESQLSVVQKSLASEKTQKEKLICDFNRKIEVQLKESNKKISDLENRLESKTARLEKLESEQTQDQATAKTLENELQSERFKNEELNIALGETKERYKGVAKQLEQAKKQISDFEEKVTALNTTNETLSRAQAKLEKNAEELKAERELERKSFEELEEKQKKAERELAKMQKLTEENVNLKSSTAELKKLLEATEARLEAYKVVVKKLESEKIEAKNTHTAEMSKLQLEFSRLEDAMRKEKARLEAQQKSSENTGTMNKRELGTPNTRSRDNLPESSCKTSTKENELDVGDIEKWRQTSTPVQSGKKFLSTPRKGFPLTPQSGCWNLADKTPIKKKRDPYEFDSDSSVEQLDQDKVLRAYNRQKKETNKRTKTNK